MAQHFSTYSDFLESPDFIQWRLTGASELDSYWHTFAQEHPELKDEFEKAIDVFSPWSHTPTDQPVRSLSANND